MFRNFLTVATRNFFRQKLYSFINVLGLASGLTCALFIYLWVNDELNKDKFYTDSDKIYHILSHVSISEGELLTWTNSPGPLAEDIREKNPEVECAVRVVTHQGTNLFQNGEKSYLEPGYYADPEFFKLFSFEIISGKPTTDSTSISTVSISRQLAEKLFGSVDAVGKTVTVNQLGEFVVAAVFENVDTRSSFKFEYILPYEIYKKQRGNGFNWGNYDHATYLKLFDVSQAQQAIDKINARRTERAKAEGNAKSEVTFALQRFSDYYLNSQFENGKSVGGRIKYVKIFSVVAVFILLIACINFMNLATARAVTRAKEVGVRKVVGSQRSSLIAQFIGESLLISFIAMVVALMITYLLLPIFNLIVVKQIVIDFNDGWLWISVIGIFILTGVLAGIYPAFFLSSYEPARVLKSANLSQAGNGTLRKSLVVFQFTLTVILIASSIVIYNQIRYIFNTNVGYNRESVLTFSMRGNLRDQFDSFKNEALQQPGVVTVSKADNSLVYITNQNASVTWPGKPESEVVFFRTVCVDYDYLETMGLELSDGRFFQKEFSDTSAFIVSERAVNVMGLSDPIGTEIVQWGSKGKIIGVVRDFHGQSMHEPIDPIVFMLRPQWAGTIFIRFEGGKTQDVIQHLERLSKKYNPQYPFAYRFLEDDFERLYSNEKVTASLALSFTVMAIIISGLGLLGLAAYTSERRRKEISIRKTMGASVPRIVMMISAEFARLNLIAAIVGCPIAYYLMLQFLEGYAYHTELRWEVFVFTALAVLVISIITVIYQVTKAAIANPIDALRNE